MDTDEKSQKAWISHFVGNWLVRARFETSRGNGAIAVRDELTAKLDSRASGDLVEEVKCIIQLNAWSNKEDIDAFCVRYYAFEKKYGIGL
jgi:hypothetical protein